ncbi:protein of unknown function [Paraburkholderia kururiensis]
MQRGVMYGVLAGALWGMVFLVPRQLSDFSPFLLSSGRYVMYGLVSLAALLPMIRTVPGRLTREDLAPHWSSSPWSATCSITCCSRVPSTWSASHRRR